MKFDNVKYLVFGPEGELIDGNEVTVNRGVEFIGVEFGLGTMNFKSTNTPNEVSIAGTCNNLHLPGVSARTQSHHVMSNDYFFAECKILGKQYAAIVYHDGLESNAPYLFYEWYEFFLPKRVPFCCCKTKFYKTWLPYVNKVYESVKARFPEYGKYHKDDCVNDHYMVGPKSLNVMPDDLPTGGMSITIVDTSPLKED